MAIRIAKQAGNWSDPLTWDDGLTIPTTGDEVYLNNYNIIIDQDITTGFIANSITPIGVPLDPIPDMTSNTSPIGVGQAFAALGPNLDAWKPFRKGINTFLPTTDGWLSTSGNVGQVGFQFNSAKSIQRYAWYSNQQSVNYRPRNWNFEGSNDGTTWVILHTVTNATNAAAYNSPNISNPSSYTYYRINITATQGGWQIFLNGLSMTESTSLSNGYLSGGTATIPASRTVNADLYHGNATLITITAASPNVINITGNMPGTKAGGTGISVTGNCTLNYVGDVVATAINGTTTACRGIITSAAATLNVTGDVSGGSVNYPPHTNGRGIELSNGATLTLVGNVTGGINRFNRGIVGTTNNIISVTGNVTGGAGTEFGWALHGISLGSTTTPCSVVGNVSAGVNSYGIFSGTTPVRITGNLQNNSSGLMAVSVPFLYLESTNMDWQFRKYDLTTNTLYTPGVATGHPAINNVRTGIVYGPTSNLTGTCAVPPANTVSLGVPVDNTVGTASLDANALAIALDASLSASLPAAIAPLLWDEDVANLTTPNSIGERLKNCATVATTGAQIASFNP
jgi:hypothetical protein